MIEDAEKKIARLMRESTTSGESRQGGCKIKVRSRGSFVAKGDVTLTINIHQINIIDGEAKVPLPTTPTPSGQATPDHFRKLIGERCTELGDPLLYQPFIKALFKADRLDVLGASQLARVGRWLGLPAGQSDGQ